MTLDFLNDGELFNWVRIRPSDGALILGLDDTQQLQDQKLIRAFFFDQTGNTVVDAVSRQAFTLEGAYSWEYLPDGLTPYLLFRGGKLSFPINIPMGAADEVFFSMNLLILSFPSQNTAIYWSGNMQLVLRPDGKLVLPLTSGQELVSNVALKKGWNSVMILSRRNDWVIAIAMYVNGQEAAQGQFSYSNVFLLRNQDTGNLGGWEFGIRSFYLGYSLQLASKEGLPGTTGSWVSKVFSFPEKRQVFAVAGEADLGGNDSVRVTIEADDSGTFLLPQKAEVAMAQGYGVYPTDPVAGRFIRVTVELASSAGSVAVKRLSIRLAPYPTVLPVVQPPVPDEGDALEIEVQPQALLAKEGEVRLSQPPLFILREGSTDLWAETPIQSTCPFDGDLLIGFTGGTKLPTQSQGLGEIKGMIRLERDTTGFFCDGNCSCELVIDGQSVFRFTPQGSPGSEPSWNFMNIFTSAPGWHPFVLRFNIGEEPVKLAIGTGVPGAVAPVSRADLSGIPDALALDKETRRVPPPRTLVFGPTQLVISTEGKSDRYTIEAGFPAGYPGYGTARTLQSPYLANPRITFLERKRIGARIKEIVSDSVRLFVSDEKGLVMCFYGEDPAWARHMGRVTGNLACDERYLYVPTVYGLYVLEKHFGGTRGRVRRAGAFPTSVMPYLGRLYIGWSDHVVSVASQTWEILESIGFDQGNPLHLDVPHGDAPYGRAWHFDTPHSDVAHNDHFHEYHEKYTTILEEWIHYDSGKFERQHKDAPHEYHTDNNHGSWHGDVSHGDVAHSDQPHADQLHADTPPHADRSLSESELEDIPWGKGTNPVERGLNHQILVYRPTAVFVLNEDMTVEMEARPRTGKVTAAYLSDEMTQYPWSRLLFTGEDTGQLTAYSLLDREVLFETRLDGPVVWVMPIKEGVLVGHGSSVSMVSPADGEVVATVNLRAGKLLPCPVRDRNKNLYVPAEHGLFLLNGALDVLDYVGFEEEVSAFLLWKDGNLAVAAGTDLYLFAGASSRPSLELHWFPEQPTEGEPVTFWADVVDPHVRVARVTWDFGFTRKDGVRCYTSFPFQGEHTLYVEAVNAEGQATIRRRVIRVRPSSVPWQRSVIVAPHPLALTLVRAKEGEVIIFPQAFSEIYRDQVVVLRLDLRGDGSNLTGRTVRFILKSKEEESASAIFTKDFIILNSAEGLAEVELTPSELKSIDPGKYFWAVSIYQGQSLVSTVARGLVEIREGMV